MHLTEAGYRAGVETMRYGTFRGSRVMPLWRTELSENDKDTIAKYLSSNFGPNSPQRDYRRPEYPTDENVVSKAIYVQYDIPEELAQKGPGFYHDAFIASDRSIWLGAINSGMMVHLKPNALNPAERYKVYTTASDDAGPHGIAEDRQGHIYYAWLHSGTLGEIDTETGKVTEHQAPFMSRTAGSAQCTVALSGQHDSGDSCGQHQSSGEHRAAET
jgi:hypothetical protein